MKGSRALGAVLTIAATVACDWAAKTAARRWLSGRPPVDLLGGAVRLRLTENPGAFLGLGDSLPQRVRSAALVGVVGIALVAALAWLLSRRDLPLRRGLAAAVMLGGGLANLLDRLPDAHVTDYVVLSAGPLKTGVFNLADVAILAGALAWLLPRKEAAATPA